MPLIPIEDGIPVSKKRNVSSGRPRKYPFPDLNVGQSFFIPDGKRVNISASATSYAQAHHVKFTVRTVDGGVRVWRTK